MTAQPDKLAALRREIDTLDERLHDLLMRRAEVVAEIGRAKSAAGGATYRPAREAQLTRRLLERHHGPMPAPDLVRIWREIVGSATRLQGDFTIAYCTIDSAGSADHLIALHFGPGSRVRREESPLAVIAAVSRGEVQAGLVPLPGQEETAAWWSDLGEGAGGASAGVHIVSRLPFFAGAEAGLPGAFAVSPAIPEPSGDDRSVFAVRCADSVSRARLRDAFTANGLEPGLQVTVDDPGMPESRLHLVDVAGFLSHDDAAVAAAARQIEAEDIRRLGAYATPLVR